MSGDQRARALARLVALRLDTTDPGLCPAWVESADRRCGKQAAVGLLCARHHAVAEKRLTRAVEEEAARRAKPARPVADLIGERDELAARAAHIGGWDRHATTGPAAYGGVGVRQSARGKRKAWAGMDRALAEFARIRRRIEELDRAIAARERDGVTS